MSTLLKFNIFESIYNFFAGFENLIGFQELCYIVFGLFILFVIITLIRASLSYEVKLIKSIDKINAYLNLNPHINDDNLIAFNDKMKKVPKELRKQWQQYMLYREQPASYYLSYKQCVENPIKTSVYKQQIKFLNVITYMLAFVSFFLSINLTTAAADIILFFRQIFILPVIILLINWLITIFMNARINAITADLFSNFHYFQLNIDKATKTLPEYVDYEVLFTKKEIKQGIPVLFEYLEKRTQIEQEALEKARLKNIEHDRYNFEKMTVESSLVLERAMNEAETYHANRRKLMTEIDQISTEVNNIQNNYKQATKDYQRKMQASKENLERLKQQMEQAASNIEANYIKKQQTDEINRQQGLERDFDNVTARQKKDLQNLQLEIDKRETEINSSRALLEQAMMSEFDSYSHKVYDKLEGVLEEKTQEKIDTLTKEKNELAEAYAKQKDELENIYAQYQVQSEKFAKQTIELESQLAERDYAINQIKQTGLKKKDKHVAPTQSQPPVEQQQVQVIAKEEPKVDFKDNMIDKSALNFNKDAEIENAEEQESKFVFAPQTNAEKEPEFKFEFEKDENAKDSKFELKQDEEPKEKIEKTKFSFENENEEEKTENNFVFKPEEISEISNEELIKAEDTHEEVAKGETVEEEHAQKEVQEEPVENKYVFKLLNDEPEDEEPKDDGASEIELPEIEEIEKPKSELKPDGSDEQEIVSEPIVITYEEPTKIANIEQEKNIKVAPKRRGRPKKVVEEPTSTEPKKHRGRPKKSETTENAETVSTQKRGRGRPKKVEVEIEKQEVVRHRGRPKKSETTEMPIQNKKPGRPKKVKEQTITETPKRRGRPKKVEIVETSAQNKKPGRPKKVVDSTIATTKQTEKRRGRPKKVEDDVQKAPKRGRGRPKKN